MIIPTDVLLDIFKAVKENQGTQRLLDLVQKTLSREVYQTLVECSSHWNTFIVTETSDPGNVLPNY
jgi:hypothetical protein